jgi:hypothetical protein
MGGVLASLPAEAQRILTGERFFPDLISAPFHHGLIVVFAVSAGLAVVAAVASLTRGPRAQRASSPGQLEGEPMETGAGDVVVGVRSSR